MFGSFCDLGVCIRPSHRHLLLLHKLQKRQNSPSDMNPSCVTYVRSACSNIILHTGKIENIFDFSQLLHYLLTYLLTPCSRVLLEKLASLQLVKKFPAFLWNPKVPHRTHKRPPPVPFLLHETSSRGTPLPNRRCEWGSSLPPDCFVSRVSISTI